MKNSLRSLQAPPLAPLRNSYSASSARKGTRAPLTALVALVSLSLASSDAHASEPDWIPTFEGASTSGTVGAMTTFDRDGDGPEEPTLYVLTAQELNRQAGQVLRWTGRGFEPVGGDELADLIGLPPFPTLLNFDPDGPGPQSKALFAQLIFGGSQPRAEFARFDGVAWQRIASAPELRSRVQIIAGAMWCFGTIEGDYGLYRSDNGTDWTLITSDVDTGPLTGWDPDGGGPLEEVPVASPSPGGVSVWDGTQWIPLGLGQPQRPGPSVRHLVSYDTDHDGPQPPELYALEPNVGLWAWNGAQWRVVRECWIIGDIARPVAQPFVHDEDGPGPRPPALYFLGLLQAPTFPPTPPPPTGLIRSRVLRWDGSSLTALGEPDLAAGNDIVGGPIPRLDVQLDRQSRRADALITSFWSFDFDGDGPRTAELLVGGQFVTTRMLPSDTWSNRPDERYLRRSVGARFLAAWDGSSWRGLGRGLVSEEAIAPNIFSPLDPVPLHNGVHLVEVDVDGPGPEPGRLYVGGDFSAAGNVTVPLAANATYASGGALRLTEIAGANARWSATSGWEEAGLDPEPRQAGGFRRVRASVMFDGGALGATGDVAHIAGSFDMIDGVNAGPLARWNPAARTWQNFGQLLPAGSTVTSMVAWDADGDGPRPRELYVAGSFTDVVGTTPGGGSAAGSIVRWDGVAWRDTGFITTSGTPNKLVVFDQDGEGDNPGLLIAVGNFVAPVQDGQASDVAAYDGIAWRRLGHGAFAPRDPLFTWLTPTAAAVFDDDCEGPEPPALFVGVNATSWTSDDGVTVVNTGPLAKWDGATWSSGGLRQASTCVPWVSALRTFDPDGNGPLHLSLFAAGNFSTDGADRIAIAKRNAAAWTSIGLGLRLSDHLRFIFSGCVFGSGQANAMGAIGNALEVFDDDGGGPNPPALFVAGAFTNSGAHSAWGIAKWGLTELAAPPVCVGDGNADDRVSFGDITAVLGNFGSTSTTPPRDNDLIPGDADASGTVDFNDIAAVLANFGQACE